ncbi:MAG TPA: hypothetical protein PLP25_12175, partial [Candidatus Limiplasma sp.]|nr:hypothetical protein [Candidatus Limiplasma sp.]
MNREPEHMEPKPVQTERPVLKELKQLLKKLWRMLYHNLPWKRLALVIAICLWAGLITQDPTLTRER